MRNQIIVGRMMLKLIVRKWIVRSVGLELVLNSQEVHFVLTVTNLGPDGLC
jgi:hypothetical protein